MLELFDWAFDGNVCDSGALYSVCNPSPTCPQDYHSRYNSDGDRWLPDTVKAELREYHAQFKNLLVCFTFLNVSTT